MLTDEQVAKITALVADSRKQWPLDISDELSLAEVLLDDSEELLTEVERLRKRNECLEAKCRILDNAWTELAHEAEWECDCKVCADIRALTERKIAQGGSDAD